MKDDDGPILRRDIGKAYKGLAFGFEDPDELGFWQMLDLSDQTLFVESA